MDSYTFFTAKISSTKQTSCMIVKQVVLQEWCPKNFTFCSHFFFHSVSLWEKFLGCSASHDVLITQFEHYENWPLSLALFLEALAESYISHY